MKRFLIPALTLVMLLSLSACGTQTPAQEEPSPQPLSPIVDEIPASESSAHAEVPLPPASETDAEEETDTALEERIALAQEFIGLSAEELIEAIGEPESSQYGASCEEEGAEDGMLFYDGFYIWTLKTEDEELVREVYPDE